MMKVLIADDDPLTMAGITALLDNTNFNVVATVNTGIAVIEALRSTQPEMLVLDNDMPERSGLDVLRALRNKGDERLVVLLTGNITDELAREAIQLQVNGIVIKATAPRDLLICLESVAQGKRWIDQEIMQRVMEQAMSPNASRHPFDILTRRERATTTLAQRGLRNKEIADELGLTEGTVKVHLHKAFRKLEIRGRAELILLAQKHNLDNH